MLLELLGIWFRNREPVKPNRPNPRTENSQTQEPKPESSVLVQFGSSWFWSSSRFRSVSLVLLLIPTEKNGKEYVSRV